MRQFLYGTPIRRILMRFLEIFILAGFFALINAPELEIFLVSGLGTGIAATILKFLREITQ